MSSFRQNNRRAGYNRFDDYLFTACTPPGSWSVCLVSMHYYHACECGACADCCVASTNPRSSHQSLCNNKPSNSNPVWCLIILATGQRLLVRKACIPYTLPTQLIDYMQGNKNNINKTDRTRYHCSLLVWPLLIYLGTTPSLLLTHICWSDRLVWPRVSSCLYWPHDDFTLLLYYSVFSLRCFCVFGTQR